MLLLWFCTASSRLISSQGFNECNMYAKTCFLTTCRLTHPVLHVLPWASPLSYSTTISCQTLSIIIPLALTNLLSEPSPQHLPWILTKQLIHLFVPIHIPIIAKAVQNPCSQLPKIICLMSWNLAYVFITSVPTFASFASIMTLALKCVKCVTIKCHDLLPSNWKVKGWTPAPLSNCAWTQILYFTWSLCPVHHSFRVPHCSRLRLFLQHFADILQRFAMYRLAYFSFFWKSEVWETLTTSGKCPLPIHGYIISETVPVLGQNWHFRQFPKIFWLPSH